MPGEYDAVIELMRPLAEDPTQSSIPPIALLSSAHIYGGEWDVGLEFANRLPSAQPRDE